MNSKEKLAQALQEEYDKLPDGKPATDYETIDNRKEMVGVMLNQAIAGYYSDYDSPLATPCIQLIKDLDALGLTELSTKAKEGEFDATKEESDAWYEREGKAMIEKELPPEMHSLFSRSKEDEEAKSGIKGWDY